MSGRRATPRRDRARLAGGARLPVPERLRAVYRERIAAMPADARRLLLLLPTCPEAGDIGAAVPALGRVLREAPARGNPQLVRGLARRRSSPATRARRWRWSA